MDFGFDEEQLEFRAQLRALAEKSCTPSDIRTAWESETGWSADRWKALAELGVVGLTTPTDYGGLGLGLVDLVLLLEEAGRAGLPEPLLETAALAVPLLVDAVDSRADGRRARWLPGVASGDAVLTVATNDMTSGVPGALGADLLLLEHDGELHAVPAEATERRAVKTLDGGRRRAEVIWEPAPDTLMASGDDARSLLSGLHDRGAMGTAAVLLGVADRMITMGADYAKERIQFGQPIGSFQAVKHQMAGALVRLEFARPAVYRSAWSLDAGDAEASEHASMAKALAGEAALLAARVALQVHGAIGYTWEHDLHLWMKRAWSLVPAWGDPAEHRARVLAAMTGEGSR
jgi:alkylation response protein AidB-like acyl-CoA dehydrogenase